jgi:hypothetical protein
LSEAVMDAKSLFEILMREHSGMLTAYLHTVVRDPSAADDLFQEIWMTAWRRLDDFDKSRPFGPWLRGIAAKVILAWRRQQRHAWLLCDEQVLEHLDHRCEDRFNCAIWKASCPTSWRSGWGWNWKPSRSGCSAAVPGCGTVSSGNCDWRTSKPPSDQSRE